MRALRAWRRSSLRHAISRRHLSLDGLPRGTRILLLTAGSAGTALCAIVVYNSTLGGSTFFGDSTYERHARSWPAVVVLGSLLGLAVVQLLLVRLAALASGTRRSAFAMLVVVIAVGLTGLVWRSVDGQDQVYSDGPGALHALNLIVLIACLATSAIGIFGTLSGHRAASYAGLLPVLLVAAAWLTAVFSGAMLTGPPDSRVPDELRVSNVIGYGVFEWVLSIAGAGLAITLWQVVEAVRASRDGADAAAVGFSRRMRAGRARLSIDPWTVVAVLLAAKLGWLLLGLVGWLPGVLGGTLEVWAQIRDDGFFSWSLAGGMALGLLAWLRAGCPGPREHAGMISTFVAVVAGLALPEVVYQTMVVSAMIALDDTLTETARWVEFWQMWAPVMVIAGAGVAAVVRFLAGRRDTGTLFLAAFALWGLVRVPAIATDLIRYPWFPWGLGMSSEAGYGNHPAWVASATLDLAVTATLTGIAVAAALGLYAGRLVPVLLVGLLSTIVVYVGLLTDVLLSAAAGNAVAFVLPFVYLYLFDAEDLNEPTTQRERRLISVVALSVLALTVGVVRAYLGDPVAAQDLQLAAGLLVIPTLVITIVTTLAGRAPRGATDRGSGSVGPNVDPAGQSLTVDAQPAQDQ